MGPYIGPIYRRPLQSDSGNIVRVRAETGSKFWTRVIDECSHPPRTRVLDTCYPPRTRVLDSMTTLPSGIDYPRNTRPIVHV